MSWIRVVVSAGLMVAVASGYAMAQDAPEPGAEGDFIKDSEDPNVLYRKKTEYDFEDDVVEGSFVRPEGEYLDARRGGRHSSLIRIRENFVPEMLKSAEDI